MITVDPYVSVTIEWCGQNYDIIADSWYELIQLLGSFGSIRIIGRGYGNDYDRERAKKVLGIGEFGDGEEKMIIYLKEILKGKEDRIVSVALQFAVSNCHQLADALGIYDDAEEERES